jgi:hypothetical protein
LGLPQVDQFSFSLPSLGQLRHLELLSDGTGRSPAWLCDMVSVKDTTSGETAYFLSDR